MPTYAQREFAGVSNISEPALPAESKHDLDEAHRKANEIALYKRDLRKLDGTEIKLYGDNQKIQLVEAFDTKKAVENELKEQLKHWGLKYVKVQSSPRIAS